MELTSRQISSDSFISIEQFLVESGMYVDPRSLARAQLALLCELNFEFLV